MEVLFIGGLFMDDMAQEIIQNTISGSVQYAANKFQKNIIDGLSIIDKIRISVLSAPFVGTYPKEYKKLYFKGGRIDSIGNVKYKSISFFNLWGIRNFFRSIGLQKELNDFIHLDCKDKKIIVYSPHTPFLEAACFAKSIDKNINICLIVPDLPQYMNLNDKQSALYKILKRVDIKKFNNLLKYVDSYVLITKQMKDMLDIGDKPYIVLEGIVDGTSYSNTSYTRKNEVKSITYTGTLNRKFGIEKLVNAFSQIENDNIVLNICGMGDSVDFIKKAMEFDKRIIYLGQMTNEEAIDLQLKSTILINPRTNDDNFTKYSFPYKTMEYLSSGRPVIANKLHGIPDDYDDYIYYFENDIDSLKWKIIDVLNLSDKVRDEFGQKAKEYVMQNKNAKIAGQRIYKMLIKE